jgi:hypothetical protein
MTRRHRSLAEGCVMLWVALGVAGSLGCQDTSSQDQKPIGLAMTPETHEAMFPIAAGTHAGITCNTCHGEFDTFTQFNCTNCHSHTRELTDPTHLGFADGYKYGPQTCYACHPHGEKAGFDHTALFPIQEGSVHAPVACGDCHTDPTDRKAFACTTCHVQDKTASLASNMTARHAGVADYRWTNTQCYQCHPNAQVPLDGVDHTAFFPISPGTRHAGISCSTCHTTPGDRKRFECTGCHARVKTADSTASNMDARHVGVSNYQWASPNCYACHPTANSVGVGFVHSWFPISTGAVHDNAKVACLQCHPTPGDKKVFECTACHARAQTSNAASNVDARHSGVSGYSWASSACLSCHPNAQVPLNVDHAKFFPIQAGAKHTGLACSDCHTSTTDRTRQSCAGTCHPSATMTTKHSRVGGYAYSSPTCLRCHADSQVDRVSLHTWFNIQSGKHYRESCLRCHPTLRTDKPFGENFKVCSCKTCHSNITTCP